MSQETINSVKFWAKVKIGSENECWPWLGSQDGNGYGTYYHNRRILGAHRVSFALTNGEIPKGLCICHKCDNPICVNPNHHFLGTKADNARDMWRKGRNNLACGETHWKRKLSVEKINLIKSEYALGFKTHQEIADMVGVSRCTVTKVLNGTVWRHLLSERA